MRRSSAQYAKIVRAGKTVVRRAAVYLFTPAAVVAKSWGEIAVSNPKLFNSGDRLKIVFSNSSLNVVVTGIRYSQSRVVFDCVEPEAKPARKPARPSMKSRLLQIRLRLERDRRLVTVKCPQ